MNLKKQKNIETVVQVFQFVVTLYFAYLAYRWVQNEQEGYEAKIVLWGFVFQLLPQVVVFLLKFKMKHDRKALLKKHNRQQIDNKLLDDELPDIPRISIIGIGSVGKTTLIESICQKEHRDTVTYGKTAYIANFSDKHDLHAALLDGTGQSQSIQNDNALRAKMLIIILDHNDSKTRIKIDLNRLEEHKNFLLLLKERLQTANNVPVWIHFLLNKSDLWNKNTNKDKQELKLFFSEQIKKFQEIYPMMEITHDFHSNNQTNDCSKLILKIAQHLSQ